MPVDRTLAPNESAAVALPFAAEKDQRSLRETVETIADRLAQAEETERRIQLLQELRGVMRRLDSLSDGLNRSLRPAGGGPPTVRWMERSSRGQNVSLSVVPLDLAPILRQLLFDRLETVVLTSATLAAAGEFDFLESRLGLNGESSPVTVREIFPSPFDYPSQCVFGVPNDLPEPMFRGGDPFPGGGPVAGNVQDRQLIPG